MCLCCTREKAWSLECTSLIVQKVSASSQSVSLWLFRLSYPCLSILILIRLPPLYSGELHQSPTIMLLKSIAIQLPFVPHDALAQVWPSLAWQLCSHHPFTWHRPPICIIKVRQKYQGRGSLEHSHCKHSDRSKGESLQENKKEDPNTVISKAHLRSTLSSRQFVSVTATSWLPAHSWAGSSDMFHLHPPALQGEGWEGVGAG